MTDDNTANSHIVAEENGRIWHASPMPGGVTEDDAAPQSGRIVTRRDVSSVPDEELLRRAVRSCRSRNSNFGSRKAPRWIHVMGTFALGSTFSAQLCRRFGLDPDEMVK